jgi:hypothetical protein
MLGTALTRRKEQPVLYTLIFAGLAILLVVAFFLQRSRKR